MMLVISLGAPPVAATSHSADRLDVIPGWQTARWGMDLAALDRAFEGSLTKIEPPLDYGRTYAPRLLRDVDLGGVRFRAIFQFTRAHHRLTQVLLDHRRLQVTPDAITAVVEALRAGYGAAHRICVRPKHSPTSANLVWRFPASTIHASVMDHLTTDILFRDPNRDIDPRVPWREQEIIDQRRLPRRILLRFHDSGAAWLDPDGACRALDSAKGDDGNRMGE